MSVFDDVHPLVPGAGIAVLAPLVPLVSAAVGLVVACWVIRLAVRHGLRDARGARPATRPDGLGPH